jgi:hypothetical protein
LLRNILLSKLSAHTEEIIIDHWCVFKSNRLSTDIILFIGQIVKRKWEHIEIVHQIFLGFNEVYDSVSCKSNKICLNETCSKV